MAKTLLDKAEVKFDTPLSSTEVQKVFDKMISDKFPSDNSDFKIQSIHCGFSQKYSSKNTYCESSKGDLSVWMQGFLKTAYLNFDLVPDSESGNYAGLKFAFPLGQDETKIGDVNLEAMEKVRGYFLKNNKEANKVA